ncbi:MAG TPA: hypothetical protein VK179_14165 [Bacteroidales bacterium]|nr:hypothetical protein [Bacteroidales bacterium]
MNRYKFLLILLVSFINLTCDDIGIDKNYPIPSNSKFIFKQGDTLIYKCGNKIEKYDIPILVNGKYYQYRSGTCMKGVLDLFDFQAIFIKPVDSIATPVGIGNAVYDCDGPPMVKDYYISIVKNVVNTFYHHSTEYDADLCWYKQFHCLESEYSDHFQSIILNEREFKNIYVYQVDNNLEKGLSKLYYSKQYGFVGYMLNNGDIFNLTNPLR